MGGGTLHVDHLVPQLRSNFNNLSSSSSSSSPSNLKPPISSSTDDSTLFSPHNTLSCCSCHSQYCRKMELVDGKEGKTASDCLPDSVFGVVPSQWEVEEAVSSLQEFMQAVSSPSTLQQISGSYDSRIAQSQGYRRLHDALQLLQADPAIKRLVVSLSSDKAVWDAVMSHVLHQKFPEVPDSGKYRRPQISEQNEFSMFISNWIHDIIKGKILELIESFMSLLNDLFQSPKVENATSNATELDEKVRSSLLLSIVILLIVIMARFQRL